jgi:hypothetical protein
MTTNSLVFDLILTGGIYAIPIVIVLAALVVARQWRRRRAEGSERARSPRLSQARGSLAEGQDRA